MKKITCFKSNRRTLTDITLTNKPRSYQKAQNFVTGISDSRKLILTISSPFFKKINLFEKPKMLLKEAAEVLMKNISSVT